MRAVLFGSLSLVIAVGVLSACHDSNPPPKSSTDTASAAPTASASPMTPEVTGDAVQASNATPAPAAPAKPAPTLTDADIAAVETAANQGEIAMAQLANKTSKNAQVKSFAAMMITQHGDAEAKAKKIAQSAKITPTDNDVSTKVKSDGDATMTSLKGQKGADFDKAYMDSQVKVHQEVLATIDEKLLPSVHNADLKAHLGDVRTHVVHHLEKAKEINQGLAASKP